MLLGPERKKAVTIILAGLGNGGGGEHESDADYAKKACARRIMDCLEKRDVEGFCEFMCEFMEMSKGPSRPKPDDMEF